MRTALLECKAIIFSDGRVKGPSRDEIADELAAFANARGGVLVLGVDDRTREIVGIPPDRLDVAERFVRELVQDLIKPPLLVGIEKMELPGRDGRPRPVIKVDVPRSLFVHQSPGGYFYRVGSSKRRMDTEYLIRLGQQPAHPEQWLRHAFIQAVAYRGEGPPGVEDTQCRMTSGGRLFSENEVRGLLDREEGQFLEFKSLWSQEGASPRPLGRRQVRDMIAEYVAAFANADGGLLMLGVEDDGRATGHAYPEEAIVEFIGVPDRRLRPQVRCRLDRIRIEGSEILLFDVHSRR